jgi:Na+-driven multidrug efflux pump
MRVHVSARHIWTVSLPVIFAGLSETVVEITDLILLGRYGTTELAAIGLADAVYAVCLFLTNEKSERCSGRDCTCWPRFRWCS